MKASGMHGESAGLRDLHSTTYGSGRTELTLRIGMRSQGKDSTGKQA